MFERYTETARRTIFFARYEASQFGSPLIEADHLLLALLRENKTLFKWIPKAQPEIVRQRIENRIPAKPRTEASTELPLSDACKHVLHKALDEADRLDSKFIGTEHLLLALLQEPNCAAAELLQELGANLDYLRLVLGKLAQVSSANDLAHASHLVSAEGISIHGVRRPLRFVLETVSLYRQHKWYWHKQAWTPRDAVSERKTGKLSLDLTLAIDSANFELVKGAWKTDHCVICHWTLFESKEDVEHGTAFTNGRDWLCLECYDKFWERPKFISPSFSDIT
jgi:hypothetical protein